MSGGVNRLAYNAWLSHVTSLGYMLRFQPPPARVISIGCGTAVFDVLLASHGYQVTSVDNDPTALEAARQLARHFNAELDIRLGDAFDLKEHHGRFDLAFSAGLVEHWNGTRTLDLILEHARCAPRLQVEVPTRYSMLLERVVADVSTDMHLYRPREFATVFSKAGLKVEKVYPVGSVPTRTREVLESLVPPLLFRRLQRLTGYSMGTGCIARRSTA